MRPLLVPLLVLAMALPAAVEASHFGRIVLLDVVVEPGETRLVTFRPPVSVQDPEFSLACPGGLAYVEWIAQNTTGDPWHVVCGPTGGFFDVTTTLVRDVEYGLRVLALEAPVHLHVEAYPAVWYDGSQAYDPFDDGRVHLYHWQQDGPDFWVQPALVGTFTTSIAYTDVALRIDGSGAVEFLQTEPEIREVRGTGSEPGEFTNRYEDLEAGASYAVYFALLGSCQPECFATNSIDISAVPRGE